MKKYLPFSIVFFLLFFFFLPKIVFAVYQTTAESTVKVGKPPETIIPITQASCPIPKGPPDVGKVTCGTKWTLRSGCGHCGVGYPPDSTRAYCDYDGNWAAIDIKGYCNTPIYLPSIDGNVIEWTYLYSQRVIGGNQQAHIYTGRNIETGVKYWLEFHHTVPGSQNEGTHNSGELAAKVTCNGFNHTHMQIASGNQREKNHTWIDAGKTFCLGQ